jgi:hypothetical protein
MIFGLGGDRWFPDRLMDRNTVSYREGNIGTVCKSFKEKVKGTVTDT